MLHGVLSSAAQWQPNLAELGKVCRPVTIELWGHGQSPAPEDTALYSPAGYGRQFDLIRQQLGAETWFVCGYSLGAGLIMRYAMAKPEHVLGVVFTNSASAFASPDQVRRWQEDTPATAARILERGHAAIEKIPVHPKYAKRLPADVKEALLEDAANMSPEGVANTLLHTNPAASVRDLISSNPIPALMCFGKFERKFQSTRDWIVEHMPNLTHVDLDAGHGVNMEDPDGFNQAVSTFIEYNGS